ncbi:MAG: HNH endonuclease, partial [Byssovorax sp.]
GARSSDFKAANQAAGFDRTPQGYSWHHLDDYDPATKRGTLQLVETSAHQANTPHSGGVKQSEAATGVKYGR